MKNCSTVRTVPWHSGVHIHTCACVMCMCLCNMRVCVRSRICMCACVRIRTGSVVGRVCRVENGCTGTFLRQTDCYLNNCQPFIPLCLLHSEITGEREETYIFFSLAQKASRSHPVCDVCFCRSHTTKRNNFISRSRRVSLIRARTHVCVV